MRAAFILAQSHMVEIGVPRAVGTELQSSNFGWLICDYNMGTEADLDLFG